MNQLLDVRLEGLIFHGYATIPAHGFYVGEAGLEGYQDSVDARRQQVDRVNAHGSFDVPGYLTPRDITLSGFCKADSISELAWMRSRIMGILADGQSSQITVDYQGETTYANVRRGLSRPTFDSVGGELVGEYSLSFWAADPRKYGDVRTSGPASSVDVFHYGNFPGLAVLTVTGSAGGGYTIYGPAGKQYIVTQPLVSGTPHQISMRDGYLRINGSVVVGGVSRGDTWTIPSGTVVPLSVSAGQLSVRVRDTFV